jgi:hypothetical protein
MTHIDHMDPFATTSMLGTDDDPERITAGRYRLPDLNGEPRKGGWQRVTTMVKAVAEARALDLWHQRQLLTGLALRPDLYDLLCATLSGRDLSNPDNTLKADLEDLAGRVLLAAGADVGANLGTAFHGFAEAQDLGMAHYARKRWHGRLSNYSSGMTEHQLKVVPELVERKVVILRYGLAGTLDRVLEDQVANVRRIGDLKSQKKFWTWLEISAQLAAYQMADAMWNRARACYEEFPEVADDLAVVAWSPEATDQVDFFDVDLVKGREILELSHKVERLLADVRSKNQTVGTLRPLPAMTLVESYAARLNEVESIREGSALWAEITKRGLDQTPELIEIAMDKAQYFSG